MPSLTSSDNSKDLNYDNLWQSLTTFIIFDNSDNCSPGNDSNNNNLWDLWPLRNWLQFWQLRTWMHDNLCAIPIRSDTGQHLQFLRCFWAKMLKGNIVTTQNWQFGVNSAPVAMWMTNKCMYFRTSYRVYFWQQIKKAPGKKVGPCHL